MIGTRMGSAALGRVRGRAYLVHFLIRYLNTMSPVRLSEVCGFNLLMGKQSGLHYS